MGCANCKGSASSADTVSLTKPMSEATPRSALPKVVSNTNGSNSLISITINRNNKVVQKKRTDFAEIMQDQPSSHEGSIINDNKQQQLSNPPTIDPNQNIIVAPAPPYRLRKSIATSRVNYGKSNMIFERYEFLDKVLGTGISGAVRVARRKDTGEQFAIKTLTLENTSQKRANMLHNEVEIYLKLDHPNIAKLVEVYEDDKNIFLVMELCTGRELYDRLASRKRYSERDAAHVTTQMLEAINYCHNHHICHRDLKLENWVYAEPNDDAPLKLIDFGFSRIYNPVIPMTAMHGTVYYVSPEVMDGCYREKCDIWSIGVIVYMLLCGSPPFNGSIDYEILVKIRAANYSFAGAAWKNISDLAKDFVTHILVKDPNDRPSAEVALQHPWLHQDDNAEDSLEIDPQVLGAMRTFATTNILKRAVLGMMAFSVNSAEVEDLQREFKKIDKNKRGIIKLEDLINVLEENLKIPKAEAQKIFDAMDQTGDREVHYTEFIASTLHTRLRTTEDWTKQAFEKLDPEHTGMITTESLRSVIGDVYNGSTMEQIMATVPCKVQGQLDYDEFVSALSV